jgi:uncharacterized GH25 family protein
MHDNARLERGSNWVMGSKLTRKLCFVFWLALALAWSSSGLLAHFTWISPVPAILSVGETVEIRLGNGHDFPVSESALPTENLKVYAIAPDGSRTDLKPAVKARALTASYAVKQPGAYVFYLIQDRGVVSRTTTGWKPGGRDQHPKATQAVRLFHSSVAWSSTSATEQPRMKPQGLPLELLAEMEGTRIVFTVFHDSKPVAGAELEMVAPGQDEQSIGRTGTDGRLVYTVPAGTRGERLFATHWSQRAAQGSAYDTDTRSASAYFRIE